MEISRMSPLSGIVRTLRINITDEQLNRMDISALPADEKKFLLLFDKDVEIEEHGTPSR